MRRKSSEIHGFLYMYTVYLKQKMHRGGRVALEKYGKI